MTYPEQRAAGGGVFGCAVAEMYGSHECSLIATECPAGSLHVAEECVLVEVVDEDGRALAPGEPGEVLVTLLHNDEMPLLRYRLGDGASLPSQACGCGRTLGCLDVRVGRLEEMVRAPDGSLVHPRFLRSVYERCFGATLRAFHTVQEGRAAFLVQLDLGGEPAPPGAAERLEHEIAAYLRAPVTVRLEVGGAPAAAGLRTFTHAA
jgi:phenylacetate-CoA ligase